jgi:hypothetical protein
MSSPESGIGRGILLRSRRGTTADSICGSARQPHGNNACNMQLIIRGIYLISG